MTKERYERGDLVMLQSEEFVGMAGIVSLPISAGERGHVLVQREGAIQGIAASLADVAPAGESSTGFAQLGYQLIKLGSYVIEQKLILHSS
jgi:hypothetical protein